MSTDQRLSSLLRREAESNYSSTRAEAYRESDEAGKDSITHSGKCELIRELSERFSAPARVLDLGAVPVATFIVFATSSRSSVSTRPSTCCDTLVILSWEAIPTSGSFAARSRKSPLQGTASILWCASASSVPGAPRRQRC